MAIVFLLRTRSRSERRHSCAPRSFSERTATLFYSALVLGENGDNFGENGDNFGENGDTLGAKGKAGVLSHCSSAIPGFPFHGFG